MSYLLLYFTSMLLSWFTFICTPTLQVDRIIFCVFLKIDYNIYSQLLQYYFPPEEPGDGEGVNEGKKGEEGPAPEGEGDAMETQDRGSPSTTAWDAKEPIPALKKSITEPGT